MSVIKRVLGALSLEHQKAFTEAIHPVRQRANSYDIREPNVGRRITSERRVATRNMDEMIAMCRLVLADGAVEDHEARFLLEWIENTYHAREEWPGSILYPRLAAAMADGHLDHDEEAELLDVLAKVVGGPPSAEGPAVSRAIPFDTPVPQIEFSARSFVLTGQFVFGSRKRVTAAIEEIGGTVASSVSHKTDYLIVGTFGSDEWLHSTHGTKIIKAVELKEEGGLIRIVTEKDWTEQLDAR